MNVRFVIIIISHIPFSAQYDNYLTHHENE